MHLNKKEVDHIYLCLLKFSALSEMGEAEYNINRELLMRIEDEIDSRKAKKKKGKSREALKEDA